jgi:hypothetical protein
VKRIEADPDRKGLEAARGVGSETVVLPGNWRDRLVMISNANTRGVKGFVADHAVEPVFPERARPGDICYAILDMDVGDMPLELIVGIGMAELQCFDKSRS